MTDSPYFYEFDLDGESTAAKVVRMVGPNKRVLEIGCAYGVMTRVLVQQFACTVVGLDIDADAAKAAEPWLEKLIISDLESDDWQTKLGEDTFDVITIADVLEHLRDPQAVLCSLLTYLRPGGHVVVSIPNGTHNGILAEMLDNDVQYRPTGLLDNTHIRFFGARGVQRLLQANGLVISEFQPTKIPAGHSEFSEKWVKLPKFTRQILEERCQGDTYQFVFTALKAEEHPEITGIELEVDISPLGAKTQAMINELQSKVESQALSIKQTNALLNQVTNSFSWRITKPMRFIMRLLRHGLSPEDQKAFVKLVKRIPLPIWLKVKLRNGLYRLSNNKWMASTGIFAMLGASQRALPPVASPSELPDYVIFGVIDWHFRLQRPQQLALELASSGRRVFYVSPTLKPSAKAFINVDALDAEQRLFQVEICMPGPTPIYDGAPDQETNQLLLKLMGQLWQWADISKVVSIVDHPYWADLAFHLPNCSVVYDCMDFHEGFGNNCASLVESEKRLLKHSDLTVVTSSWLDQQASQYTDRRLMVRNACEFLHFNVAPSEIYRDPKGRKIIGYYGAIAQWFDVSLVAMVAERLKDCCILLIGADTVGAESTLKEYDNVEFFGEIPYGELPKYLHAFDICLLPFEVIPLTLATNPVKVYEYLSAGKPVVSVDLPEITQFDGLVEVGKDRSDFVHVVAERLEEPQEEELIQARINFAREQTWKHRAKVLELGCESSQDLPKVSVIVLTYNNLELTKACLESIRARSDYANLELIIVDNLSTDGSRDFLTDWVEQCDLDVSLILNETNRGFAGGNNDGLAAATGDYLVLLNNDTVVTDGWVRTLVNHFRHNPNIGLLGPVTSNIGNEAKVPVFYDNLDDMPLKAAQYTRNHMGVLYPMRTVAFFCVMLTRDTYEKVGGLDENYGRGFFEDDDYCRRVEQLGLGIYCADDVFVHHHLSASFNKLKQSEREILFNENKAIYESKWGPWVPHKYR